MSIKNEQTPDAEEMMNKKTGAADEAAQGEKGAQQTQDTEEAQEAHDENEAEQAQELTAEEKLQKELDEAKQAVEDQKDKYLRLSAEFDNYRKRTLKEKAELIKNGGAKAIEAVLPVLDDLERALQNMQKSDDVQAMFEGIELIYQKFLKNLGQEGLEKMEPIGTVFDTDFHEAVALIPAQEEDQKGKVLDCVQTGYKLHEKVLRHAKVVVAQ